MNELLRSLTNKEIDFIANLDYGSGAEKHKSELLKVIRNNGDVNFENETWYPYEVIELGSNWLQEGHEKEFACCTAIVLKNILSGKDQMNDLEFKLDNHSEDYERLPKQYKAIINKYIEQIIEKS